MNNPEEFTSISLPSGGVLAIEPIASFEELPAPTSDVAKRRQCESYTWRKVARALLASPDAQFEYNALGAPQIIDSELYISVSHSAALVAVIISPVPCAIDIESLDRNFDAVVSRYLSPMEQALTCPEIKLRPAAWSIKETLYKYAGRKGLSLLDQIKITSIKDGQFRATIDPHIKIITGHITEIFNHTLAYIG